jgi:hypothetical protein
VTIDTAKIRAIGGTLKTDTINSIKGIKAPVFTGPLTGNVTGVSDSSKGAHHLNGGTVNADSINCHGTVVQKNGYLGIGTNNPSELLTLKNGSLTVGVSGGNVNCNIYGYNSLGAQAYQIAASGSSFLNGGNIGVGTSSPAEKLTIKGNLTDTGNGSFTGTVTADSSSFRACGGTIKTDSINSVRGIHALYFTGTVRAITASVAGYLTLTSDPVASGYADSATARAMGVSNGIVWRKQGDGGILRVMY